MDISCFLMHLLAQLDYMWNWRRRDWTCRPRLILSHFWTSKLKVKQLGANMRKQVTCVLVHPFMSFINCYNASKVHNMLAFMLDPRFKDLSSVGDYVGHASIIEIPGHAYIWCTLSPSNPTWVVSKNARTVDYFKCSSRDCAQHQQLYLKLKHHKWKWTFNK
jgi:hypothetical protein